MRILLDTHTFLWFIADLPQLSSRARRLIEDPTAVRLLSMASLWEMAIKVGRGRLAFALPFDEMITRQLVTNVIDVLPISIPHTVAVSRLPHHHRDPFDRMIIAQSIVEDIPVLSADAAFDAYGIRRVW